MANSGQYDKRGVPLHAPDVQFGLPVSVSSSRETWCMPQASKVGASGQATAWRPKYLLHRSICTLADSPGTQYASIPEFQ